MANNNQTQRRAAMRARMMEYYIETPCKNGHHTARRITDGMCKQCEQEKYKKTPHLGSLYHRRPKNGDLIWSDYVWCDVDKIKQLYFKRDELSLLWKTKLVVDHIIPISSKTVCGLHTLNNLQLIEKRSNGSKGNRYQQDW